MWLLRFKHTPKFSKRKLIITIFGFCTAIGIFFLMLITEQFCLDCQKYPSTSDIFKLSLISSNRNHNYLRSFQYTQKPLSCDCETNLDSKALALIAVKSATGNIKMRDFIRFTWGCRLPKNMKLVFLLGNNAYSRDTVENEAKNHKDILQMDFTDTYYNNTLKLVMGLEYFSKWCTKFKFLVIMDDDIVTNFYILNDHIKTLNTEIDIYEGFVLHEEVIRHKYFFNKYYVSWKDYPFKFWSPYLAGAMYLVSASVVEKVVNNYKYLPYFFADDAWLGLVTKSLEITPTDNHLYHYKGMFSDKSIVKESKHDLQNLVASLLEIQERKIF